MRYDCLIIDDEKELADNTCEYFNMFEVKTAAVYSSAEANAFLSSNEPALVLLDINLSDGSGFELCKKIRQTLNIPILFISARNTDDDKIIALNIGGDDYIEKPFSFPVLSSKIKAILRRNYDASEERKELSYKDIKVDLDDMTVRKGDKVIPVNGKELDILIYFLKNPEKVIHKEVLFNAVWGTDCISEMSTLTVYIRWLREKLEDDPKNPEYIHTIWRVGYKFGGESSK